jgi:alpha/beta superfamily hydrolase
MATELRIAGDRDLRATVDTPESDACVVACPPHPQMGGSRTDAKLRAVGETLAESHVACLRFDYGSWDGGVGEQRDVRNALVHARDEYATVGLFGYSFGAGVSLLAAADSDPQPAAMAVLAPPASVGANETVPALDAIECPLQVVYGERDTTVDWEPVVERARELGLAVESVPGDHFFVGQTGQVASRIGEFLTAQLRG